MFAQDWRKAGLPEHTASVLALAGKLTLTPSQTSQDDIRVLRQCGYSDAEIHDIVQIIAYFNYINRMADALGVPPEKDLMESWPREDGDWTMNNEAVEQ
ncbi:peroxidase [Chloroflexota bacterium]